MRALLLALILASGCRGEIPAREAAADTIPRTDSLLRDTVEDHDRSWPKPKGTYIPVVPEPPRPDSLP